MKQENIAHIHRITLNLPDFSAWRRLKNPLYFRKVLHMFNAVATFSVLKPNERVLKVLYEYSVHDFYFFVVILVIRYYVMRENMSFLAATK